MKLLKLSLPKISFSIAIGAAIAAAGLLVDSARAQLVAYDDAGNYLVSANWTNGANQGFGFTPWVILTNAPATTGGFQGWYINPTTAYANASITNVGGTNYTCIWGIYANGTNAVNQTTAYRGFANTLGTNTFKVQWGAREAGSTTIPGTGSVNGWCGITLRSGNATSTASDFETGARLYLYFLNGNSPSTLYVWDDNGVQSLTGTSFSNLGRDTITNAVEAEVTPAADGMSYHMVLKDVVANQTLCTFDGVFIGGVGTEDSAALFDYETQSPGDQIYNRMQIAASTNIPPTISNPLPADGSLYVNPGATNLSFEVDSFNSTVVSNAVSVYLNGVLQTGSTFNTTSPTSQLLGTNSVTLAPDTFYTYTIAAQDANGNVVSNNFTFNTFLASDLYIDAYDYNYSEGQFINSSTPSNAYANLLGTNGIDYSIADLTGVNNTAGYRPGDLVEILSLATDVTGDPIDHANLRANSGTAYNIGFTDAGNWENYTRAVPVATNYTIYARAASGGGGQFEIEKLTNSTAATTNQPLVALGRVNVPVTGGSKVYSGQLIPLTDPFGNTVVIPLSGTNTLRETAISNDGYNLEYLVVVAVTNATSTLRPYIATASPAPNASGVGLIAPVSFTIANRQTTVNAATIKLFTNSVQVTSGVASNANSGGIVVTYTPTVNRLANRTYTNTVIYTDSASVSFTNSWVFVTGTSGGVNGTGVWSGGGGTNNMNWSSATNWTGGTPGPGNVAIFASPGATATLVTNNIVAANVTIGELLYSTNNSGYHTTWIQDGVTLTVTNGQTANGQVLQVGGYYNNGGLASGSDNVFNNYVTNTITGNNGTLLVLGNPLSSGLANGLNFQVRQSASAPIPNLVTLDMSGLGTLIATVGKMAIGQGGTSVGQSNVSARVYLARTNVITLLRAVSGQFDLGDTSGSTNGPGSTLNLGITNAFYMDTMFVGNRRATNNLMRFNPAFTSITTPVAYIRGSNALATSRVTAWNIGDSSSEAFVPGSVQGNVDFSGGKLDALVGTMIIGRGETSASDTGFAQGTLIFTAGTLDVTNLQVGVQRTNSTATATGIVNINGTATLVSTNITLAATNAGANAALVTGTLNITNGTVRGNIFAGGGVSTVNVNAGTLIVSNAVGITAVPLTALNLTSASLHLKVDANAPAAKVNATAVSASGTTITVDLVANVTSSTNIHLISYTGSDPYTGLSLTAMPSGFTGSLVDNGGSIDLLVNVAPSTPPTIRNITFGSGQLIISGTNNIGASGAGGGYHVLTSTDLTLALTNWIVLTNGSFNASGNFSSTNSVGTNNQQFYIIKVP